MTTTVSFRAACDAQVHNAVRVRKFWCDQPRPPAVHHVEPNRWSRSWHDQTPEQVADAPAARIRQASYLWSPDGFRLDPARTRMTYRRIVLVGELDLEPAPWATRDPLATEAVDVLIATLDWTLGTLYNQPPPSPRPGLRRSMPRLSITIAAQPVRDTEEGRR